MDNYYIIAAYDVNRQLVHQSTMETIQGALSHIKDMAMNNSWRSIYRIEITWKNYTDINKIMVLDYHGVA